MSGESQLRVDLGSVEGHVDESKTRHKAVRDAHDTIDRQKQHLINSMEGGAGADQLAGQRNRVSGLADETDRHANKVLDTTRNSAGDFVRNVSRAADKGLN